MIYYTQITDYSDVKKTVTKPPVVNTAHPIVNKRSQY